MPDVVVYCEAITRHYGGRVLEHVEIANPFLLRTFEPSLDAAKGARLDRVARLGKRIVFVLDPHLFAVIHLMIAGRLQRRKRGSKPRGKNDLAAFHFENDTLMLTEASRQHRASLHLFADWSDVTDHAPQGLEVLDASADDFRDSLLRENHTLKRSLTDPKIFSGIGNAYSDEILHAAKLSPTKWSQRLDDEELNRLFVACRDTLSAWTSRLREQVGDGFPERVTAFRPEMSVHGRYGQPCPVCGTSIARIRYANNETNYCPACQTGGKLLADRSLSRLLKDDWPQAIDPPES